MSNKVKIGLEIAMGIVSVLLVWLIVRSISQPVKFNKQKDYRSEVAVQRLKDIRTLQVAFKSANGRFTSSIDSLKDFYLNGKMDVVKQVGSKDDSLAMAKTEALRKKGLKDADLLKLYENGETGLVFSINQPIATKEAIFLDRTDFVPDSLNFIPFSGGKKIIMHATIKPVSGVNVPLFEAKIPYPALLKGLDEQLIINLKAERDNQNKYNGLQVGSIDAPNNNAGNWE